MGHLRSSAVLAIDRAHTHTSYLPFMETMHLSCTVFKIKLFIEFRKFFLPDLYLAPQMGVMTLEFHRYLWQQKTIVPRL